MQTNSEVEAIRRIGDRISSTENAALGELLSRLLPKLLELSNKEELREIILQLFSDILRRVKPLRTELPCDVILSLVRPSNLPFCCNFSIAFLDVGLGNSISVLKSEICAKQLIAAIESFVGSSPSSSFSCPQLNSLYFFTLMFFNELSLSVSQTDIRNGNSSHTKNALEYSNSTSRTTNAVFLHIGDWLIDLFLIYNHLQKGAVGSIQAGLSDVRVSRLTSKKELWNNEELKLIKIKIMQSFNTNIWVPYPILLILALIGLCDNDNGELNLLCQYKLNGARTYLQTNKLSPKVVLTPILDLCRSVPNANFEVIDDDGLVTMFPISEQRSSLRDEIRIQALHWMAKDMPEHIALVAESAISLIVDIVTPSFSVSCTTETAINVSVSPSSSKLFSAAITLAVVIEKSLDSSYYRDQEQSCTTNCTSNLLNRFTNALLEASVIALSPLARHVVDSDEGSETMREGCYQLIERFSSRAPAAVTALAGLPATLFLLLERESERLRTRLLATLGSLRLAHEGQEAKACRSPIVEAQLTELVCKARDASDSRTRLAALQWASGLFANTPLALHTALMLSSDKSMQVLDAVEKELISISTVIYRQITCSDGNDKPSQGPNDGVKNSLLPLRTLGLCLADAVQEWDPECEKAISNGGSPLIGAAGKLNERAVIGLLQCLNSINDALKHILDSSLSSEFQSPQGGRGDWIRMASSIATNSATSHCMQEVLETINSFPTVPEIVNFLQCRVLELQAETKVQSKSTMSDDGYDIYVRNGNSIIPLVHQTVNLCYSLTQLRSDSTPVSGRGSGSRSGCSSTLISWLSMMPMETTGDAQMFLKLARVIASANLAADLGDDENRTQLIRVLSLKASGALSPSSVGAIMALSAVVEVAIDTAIRKSIPLDSESVRNVNSLIGFMTKVLEGVAASSGTNEMSRTAVLLALSSLGPRGLLLVPAPAEQCLSSSSPAALLVRLAAKIASDTNSPTTDKYIAVQAVSACFAWSYDMQMYTNFGRKYDYLEVLISEMWEIIYALGKDSETGNVSIAVCEALVSMAHSPMFALLPSQSIGESHGLNLPVQLQKLFENSESLVSVRKTTARGKETENVFTGTSMLVLLRSIFVTQCISTVTDHDMLVQRNSFTIPVDIPLRLCRIFLYLLRSPNAFLQDVCSTGLCWCYWLALEVDKRQGTITASVVADEVIATLMREKKPVVLPAGIAIAGETTRATTTTNSAEDRRTTTGDAAVGGAGGGNNTQEMNRITDALLAAASELGVGIQAGTDTEGVQRNGGGEGEGEGEGRPGGAASDEQDRGFGIYAVVCRIAKRTRDTSIVFALLALLNNKDPTVAPDMPRNDWERANLIKRGHYFDRYRPYKITVDKSKFKDLVPPLFMARFDPSVATRDVMRTLWDSLIPEHENSEVLNSFENEILTYLGVCVGSRSWKEREASCAALASFIGQRKWKVLRRHLEVLWEGGLRAMDDVRESTRVASGNCMRALGEQILRVCDPTMSTSVTLPASNSVEESTRECDDINDMTRQDVLNYVVPFLLDKGVVTPSPEVRGFCLGFLIKVVKTVRSSLGSEHLPRLIAALVESLSGLEPRALAYMQFHTSRLHISDDELESMRLKLAQQSPMQEALDLCLASLAPEAITTSLHMLCDCLIRGVGLATIIAAARSIATVSEQYPDSIGHGRLFSEAGVYAFRTLLSGIMQPRSGISESVRHSIADSLGTMAKVVHPDELAHGCRMLLDKYRSLWMMSDSVHYVNADTISSITYALKQIVCRASHCLLADDVWSTLLQTAFIGKCASENKGTGNISTTQSTSTSTSDEMSTQTEHISNWSAIWSEVLISSGAGTLSGGLRRVLPGLVQDCILLLRSRDWTLRGQGVVVLQGCLNHLPANEVCPLLCPVMLILFQLMKGPLWKGRGPVVEVIGDILGKSERHLDEELGDSILLVVKDNSSKDDITLLQLEDIIGRLSASSNIISDNIEEDLYQESNDTLDIVQGEDVVSDVVAATTSLLGQKECGQEWRVSLRGVLALLLHDARPGPEGPERSGADGRASNPSQLKRLSAAISLYALPWEYISDHAPRVFAEYVGIMLNRAGGAAFIPAAGKLLEACEVKEGDVENDRLQINSTSSARQSISSNTASSSTVSVSVSVSVVAPAARSKSKPKTNIFGSRYGTSFESATTKKRAREGTRSQAGSVSVSVSTTSPAVGGGVPVSSEPLSRPPTGDIVPPVSSSMSNLQIGPTKADPAVRAKLLECVSRGWPRVPEHSNVNVIAIDSIDHAVLSASQTLLSWAPVACRAASAEVWSVRRGLLLAVGSVGRIGLDESHAVTCLSVVGLGLADTKYAQVRVAALKCLLELLRGFVGYLIANGRGDHLESTMKGLLRVGVSDSQPMVMEVASKAEQAFKALKIKS